MEDIYSTKDDRRILENEYFLSERKSMEKSNDDYSQNLSKITISHQKLPRYMRVKKD
jgi:hypothetical protein